MKRGAWQSLGSQELDKTKRLNHHQDFLEFFQTHAVEGTGTLNHFQTPSTLALVPCLAFKTQCHSHTRFQESSNGKYPALLLKNIWLY